MYTASLGGNAIPIIQNLEVQMIIKEIETSRCGGRTKSLLIIYYYCTIL